MQFNWIVADAFFHYIVQLFCCLIKVGDSRMFNSILMVLSKFLLDFIFPSQLLLLRPLHFRSIVVDSFLRLFDFKDVHGGGRFRGGW